MCQTIEFQAAAIKQRHHNQTNYTQSIARINVNIYYSILCLPLFENQRRDTHILRFMRVKLLLESMVFFFLSFSLHMLFDDEIHWQNALSYIEHDYYI